ncbi:MAG: aspartyl protease family protein [Gemmataceae bacterium]|nr:aspartyl protease family protein [Gemmataceae bacterium]
MIPHFRPLLVVLVAVLLGPPVRAEDKPAPKPDDARRAALLKAGYVAVPLALDPNAIVSVVCTVGTEKVKFLVDTGRPDTLLDLKVAKRLKLELGRKDRGGGLGGNFAGRTVQLPGLVIGGHDTRTDFNRFSALAGDLSQLGDAGDVGGVLGFGALDPYAAVIDYPGRTLYLRPPLKTAWPRLAGTWAVTSWQEDEAARKLDPKAPPTLTFADNRLKLTDGGTTREFGIHLMPEDGADTLLLFDPKEEGKPDVTYTAGGLVKTAGGTMTACLFLDHTKLRMPPTEFAAPKGSGLVLLELKDTGPAGKRPAPVDPLRELLTKDGFTAVPLVREPDGERVVAARVGTHDLRLVLDTGRNISQFDPAGLKKWGAKPAGEARAVGGEEMAQIFQLRGLQVGGYDTRRGWNVSQCGDADLTQANKTRARDKLPPLDGLLANLDLRKGSAVVDLRGNALYLRPGRDVLGPQVAGKWTEVSRCEEGKARPVPAGDPDAITVEFKGGRVRLTQGKDVEEYVVHADDAGGFYFLGLLDPKQDELAGDAEYVEGGLLQLADGKLRLLLVTGPDGGAIPNEFAAPKKGSGLTLYEFVRAK